MTLIYVTQLFWTCFVKINDRMLLLLLLAIDLLVASIIVICVNNVCHMQGICCIRNRGCDPLFSAREGGRPRLNNYLWQLNQVLVLLELNMRMQLLDLMVIVEGHLSLPLDVYAVRKQLGNISLHFRCFLVLGKQIRQFRISNVRF